MSQPVGSVLPRRLRAGIGIRPFSRALLAALALAGTACSNNSTPTSPTSTAAPALITESFSGSLTVNGAVTHPFVVGTTGTVSATLLMLGDGGETTAGLALGTWNTTTNACQLIITNDTATQGRVLIGTAQNAGAFCVRIYDVGRLSAATDYAITVVHQ